MRTVKLAGDWLETAAQRPHGRAARQRRPDPRHLVQEGAKFRISLATCALASRDRVCAASVIYDGVIKSGSSTTPKSQPMLSMPSASTPRSNVNQPASPHGVPQLLRPSHVLRPCASVP